MASIILTNANVYADMSDDYYKQYLHFSELRNNLPISFDIVSDTERYVLAFNLQQEARKNAIAAIVFQALAIEAYINLFGMYTLGEKLFYDKYERLSFTKKLEAICESFGRIYPQEHLSQVYNLFQKRHRLVHEKPKEFSFHFQPFDYNHLENNYSDIDAVLEADSFVLNNIADEMTLYQQLQNNIMHIRDADKELIQEIQEKQIRANMEESNKAFGSILNGTSPPQDLL